MKDSLLKSLNTLKALRDNSYLEFISACQKQECVGEEIKMENGVFGHKELNAHQKAYEWLGKHRSYDRAVELLIEDASEPTASTPINRVPPRIIELCKRLDAMGNSSELNELCRFILELDLTCMNPKLEPE